MEPFTGKLAIVTGGGSGMGRELVRQLAGHGCHVAACDVNADDLAETMTLATEESAGSVTLSDHWCDVSEEEAVRGFRDAALAAHGRDHVDMVFANAAVGAAANSFISDPREEWERVFAVNWWGVYYTARVFLPLLIASPEGVLVNTSSVNGFWASLGPDWPLSAYATAKFAVKGFTESLIEDLRVNAPHVRVALVMPGHVATNFVGNSLRAFGETDGEVIEQANAGFREHAPMTAAQAATVILDGVRDRRWRILVGEGAKKLDEFVRARPEDAYDYQALARYRDLPRAGRPAVRSRRAAR
jgi:NAD(P)-dependent dehydrogenase (short-subunit alcohol dehydrogenase family)